MNYDMIRYERGQVWMIRFKNRSESSGHEQKKDRPYLILSLGKFNKSSGMITAVPITSQEKRETPVHVKYSNDRGKDNTILVEQIRSFDISSGEYILDFLGVLSPEILEKVDVALSIHQGLHYSPITLSNLYKTMESIITSIGYMQRKADTPRFTDDDVIAFVDKMQDLAMKELSVKVEEEDTESNGVIKNDNVIELEKPVVKNEVKKSTRMKWTPETCKEFLNDAETLPMKKVMEKWDILKKSKYYSMKHYAQNLLQKQTN